MAFPTATDHTTFAASIWNSFASYSNGSASAGSNPVQWITLSDAVNYVHSVKNLDTTNGRVAIWYKADGTVLARITKDGFRYSPDGVTSDLTPASLSGIETFSGAKTFAAAATFNSTASVAGLATLTGGAALGSRLTLKRATSTASTASLTLPTDGNLVPISGTNTITSITAVTGGLAVLEFASANCKVAKGSTLRLDGDFMSAAAGASLTLECDGTNWNEVGRAGGFAQSARAASAGQSVVDNAALTPMTLSAATYDPFTMKSGNTMVVPNAALWRLQGEVIFPANGTGNRIVQVFKNSALYAEILATSSILSTFPTAAAFAIEDRFAANDILDVRVACNGVGSNLTLITRGYLGLTFVANN